MANGEWRMANGEWPIANGGMDAGGYAVLTRHLPPGGPRSRHTIRYSPMTTHPALNRTDVDLARIVP